MGLLNTDVAERPSGRCQERQTSKSRVVRARCSGMVIGAPDHAELRLPVPAVPAASAAAVAPTKITLCDIPPNIPHGGLCAASGMTLRSVSVRRTCKLAEVSPTIPSGSECKDRIGFASAIRGSLGGLLAEC